ncbi:aminotransferase class IV [Desulfamplus magnetovallimortis]|nr:aminotransferase class IV [Desulfamplus magnetovallimortis]
MPSGQAVIPVDDLAVIRGIGVCDLLRTFNGKPLFLREHAERLIQSANEVSLKINWSCRDIERIIHDTLNKNPDIDEANIRIIITGGSSEDFITPTGKPRLLVLLTSIPPIPSSWYTKGVKVITVALQRDNPLAKSLSYMPAAMALSKAKKLNGVEALYVSKEGIVTEGTTSNLFAFINNRLITAEEGVLKGITRKMILELGQKEFSIELRSMSIEELYGADEVFISGTNKGVVPVVQINDNIIGSGKPGTNTQKLIKEINNLSTSPESYI